MTDRPTPYQVLDEVYDHPIRNAVSYLEDRGMVVGYPDDPEIVRAVFPYILIDAAENLSHHPEMRRRVLAALPEECPMGPPVFGLLPPTFDWWKWLREEAFRD